MNQKGNNKYRAYSPVDLKGRIWPNNTITAAPQYCAVDLRDGNQALINPLDLNQRLEFWHLLLSVGFKEIETGFPSASQIDFKFLRHLIEKGLIPKGVVPQVLVQSRKELIVKTVESLRGAKEAIIHLYTPTSELQRRVVFKSSQSEIKKIAIQGVEWIKEEIKKIDGTKIRLQFSPESFTGTELNFSKEICEAVYEAWNPMSKSDLILNLPATVEMSTPNIYADQIEWFKGNFKHDNWTLSIHPHNDRGTATAAAELALMAGAERVEGTLFGNGERTGNLDLVTLCMNMFAQGVNTGLDFSELPRLVQVYEKLTELQVSKRHPYAGELVFTAFSGSHQDAINKGLQALEKSPSELWEVPYLPIDPNDVGQNYKALIRINSQSGKGGVAFVLEQNFGFILPKAMQHEVRLAVQKISDKKALEISATELHDLFLAQFVNLESTYSLVKAKWEVSEAKGEETHSELEAEIIFEAKSVTIKSSGTGVLEALCKGVNSAFDKPQVEILDYSEHAMSEGADAKAIAYVCLRQGKNKAWGAGIDENLTLSTLKAFISALNLI
ncbi:MAG: 2-isopropylmalate synthase [SAR324 cluster bacterium]|nr:2-isopropylmalate synthase [SAR324 cluster bacterium]